MSRKSSYNQKGQARLFEKTVGADTNHPHEPFVPGPNPKLPEFIAKHAKPYNPNTDKYGTKAYDKDLIVHKHNKFYTMHMYWSKKDPISIQEYISHYSKPGDLVLDPYAGSGTTGCAAVCSGRNVILIDVSASAGFLAHHYSLVTTTDEVQQAYDDLVTEPARALIDDELFATKCHRCGGNAITEFIIWSESFQCPKCADIVSLWDCPQMSVQYPGGDPKTKPVCPKCLKRSAGKAHRDFVISTRSKRFDPVPVGCKFLCLMGCKPKGYLRTHDDDSEKARAYFRKYDLTSAIMTTKANIQTWYPQRRMMDVPKGQEIWGVKWRNGSASFKEVSDLFTARNLKALSTLRENDKSASPISPILFFTWILHKCSHMMGYNADGVGRVDKGNYFIPPVRLETRPTKYLAQAKSAILSHYEAKLLAKGEGEFCITIEPNINALRQIPPDTIDYIFTDPPYLNPEVQYGEMNFLWDAWLKYPSSIPKETTLNPVHHHTWEDAENELRLSFSEMYRTLKPGRWASVCYHDTSEANWSMLQRAVLDAGYDIHTVTCFDPRSKSRKAITSEKIVRSDLVLNCRKPLPNEEAAGNQLGLSGKVSERVRAILVETLTSSGGQTRDKLWNVVLKRLLTRGQMAEHRFDNILAEVAFKSESGRWFLKEEFEALSESDLQNEEKAGEALVRFARVRSMGAPAAIAAEIAMKSPLRASEDDEDKIEDHIRKTFFKRPIEANKFRLEGRLKGIEFYDCLFFYLTRWLKGLPTGKTPRRNLAEFLEEYLVRFKDGVKWLYRPPDKQEAEALKKSRLSGLGRRIRCYAAFIREEGEFPAERRPDAKTLVEWLKHCAAFGLADEGVLLFDKALTGKLAQLDKEERFDAEDYASRCRRQAQKSRDDNEDKAGDEDDE